MNGGGRSWQHVQCGQAVRADRHETVCCRRLANAEGWRTSFAEVPGRSGKSDSNNTHGQLTMQYAVTHDSLVSWQNITAWQSISTAALADKPKHVQHVPFENIFYICHGAHLGKDYMQCCVPWLEAFSLRRRARYLISKD